MGMWLLYISMRLVCLILYPHNAFFLMHRHNRYHDRQPRESTNYAMNAVRLLDALEARVGESSLIFAALVKRGGISNAQDMRKTWTKKSLFYAGKAELMRKNYDEAIMFLERARKIIAGDPDFLKDEEDIKNLLTQAATLKKQASLVSCGLHLLVYYTGI